jgi:hypothetical protein
VSWDAAVLYGTSAELQRVLQQASLAHACATNQAFVKEPVKIMGLLQVLAFLFLMLCCYSNFTAFTLPHEFYP